MRVDHANETIHVSEILDFYTEDFMPAHAPSLIAYINRYVADPIPEDYAVRFSDYDWTIANSRRRDRPAGSAYYAGAASCALVLIVIRYFLGVLFVATGIGKLLDNRAFAEVIAIYQLPVPKSLLLPLALGIGLLEFTIGLNILSGRRLRSFVLATLCFHSAYTALAITTHLREIPIENCGCFGAFLARPLRWSSVAEDVALMTVSALGLRLLKGAKLTGDAG